MRVSPSRKGARPTAKKPRSYEAYSFPPPSLGLMAVNNLAVAVPGSAQVLENFIPTATGARMRRGKQRYATLGAGLLDVRSMFSYVLGDQKQLFAATDTTIYDITTVLSPTNIVLGTEGGDMLATEDGDMIGTSSTNGLEALEDQTGGNWSVVQYATAGGTFLVGVNGVDPALLYDGTGFGETTISFPNVGEGAEATPSPLTTADLSFVWVYKKRLWFLQKDSLSAWYLDVDQIGGQLTEFPLGGVFTKGGSLVFGGTWSQDVGDGLNALCAFISSEGEAAVYQGANPSSASDWGIVGVYQTGKPMGPKAHVQVGGDIVMATDIAFVPLSEALRREYSKLAENSLSAPIEALWPEHVEARRSLPWQCAHWTAQQLIVVAVPDVEGQAPGMLVMNSRTGKWAWFTNWGATCVHVFGDRLFMGTTGGRVYEANVTGLDDKEPYTATYVPNFDQFEAPGNKTVHMVRAVLRGPHRPAPKVSTHVDYILKLPPAPPAPLVSAPNNWGDANAIWGQYAWGGAPEKHVFQQWVTQTGTGEVLAPGLQLTSGAITPLDTEIVRLDVLFTKASVLK